MRLSVQDLLRGALRGGCSNSIESRPETGPALGMKRTGQALIVQEATDLIETVGDPRQRNCGPSECPVELPQGPCCSIVIRSSRIGPKVRPCRDREPAHLDNIRVGGQYGAARSGRVAGDIHLSPDPDRVGSDLQYDVVDPHDDVVRAIQDRALPAWEAEAACSILGRGDCFLEEITGPGRIHASWSTEFSIGCERDAARRRNQSPDDSQSEVGQPTRMDLLGRSLVDRSVEGRAAGGRRTTCVPLIATCRARAGVDHLVGPPGRRPMRVAGLVPDLRSMTRRLGECTVVPKGAPTTSPLGEHLYPPPSLSVLLPR